MILKFLSFLLYVPLSSEYRYLPEDTPGNNFNENTGHGRYTIKNKDRPYHALVFYGTLYCSGTLITSRSVITSASCFVPRTKQQCFVKMGANFIQGKGQILNVLEIKIHEFFGHLSEVDNDIAMLILESHVDFEQGVEKALIVESDIALRPGTSVEASGWASQERRLSDNGGPMMFKDLLIGIVSYAANFNDTPNYAIITNVSYFNRWITLNAKNFLDKYCINGHDTLETFEDY